MVDDKEMKEYNNSSDIVELGVYTNRGQLDHKIKLVKQMEDAREEDIGLARDDDGNTYDGVYWAVPFSKFKMSLEEYMEWRDGITNFDSASTPMMIDYNNHLKRIWFASEKFWQGYFEVEGVEGNSAFICQWHPLENPEAHPRSSFQGYTLKVPKVAV